MNWRWSWVPWTADDQVEGGQIGRGEVFPRKQPHLQAHLLQHERDLVACSHDVTHPKIVRQIDRGHLHDG